MARTVVAVCATAFFALAAAVAGTGELDVTGAVLKPLHLTAGTLRSLPPTEVVLTGKPGTQGTYKGVLLYKLLDQTSLKDKPGKNAFLQHSVMVIGRDGYAAALAIGEFEPNYEAKSVIIAYEVDGRPLRDGFRLVVPGDKEGGRQVHDVTRIEVQ